MRLAASSDMVRSLLILFDFCAAFPSIQWAYMFHLLEFMGLPITIVDALRELYANMNTS